MLERVIGWASAHPWRVLVALALVSALAAAQLPGLRFHISAEGMMVEHDPARARYRETRATFGEEEGLTVLFRDRDLFGTDRLQAVRATLERVAALPFVARIDSLFTARNVTSRDGEIHTRPYLEPLPTSAEATAQVLADALANPLVAGNLVGRDGRSMAAIVYLREGEGDRERQAVQAVEAALAPLSGTLEQAFVIGSPYIRVAATEAMRHDQMRILPLVLAVPVLTLAVALRRPSGAVVPLLTGGVSVVWILGLMAATGTPVNVLTSIVPALVIIVGSSETTHMLAEFYEASAAGKDTGQAIRSIALRVGPAILLTFGTTYVGFLSIATSDIQILREFGLVASTALLFNFAVTVLLVPAYLALACRRAGLAAAARPPGHRLPALAAQAMQVILSRRRTTLALLVALAGACVWGAGLVRVNNDPLDYFAPDSPVMERLARLRESLAGTESFSVVVNADIRGTFQQVHYLGQLRRIQDYLVATGRFDKTMSFADFISFVHSVMEEDTSGRLPLPESDDVVREYLLFVDRAVVAPYVSEDYSRARILVRHSVSSSAALREALADLEDFVRAEIDPALHVHITGESVLTLHATDAIGFGQAKSLGLMLVVIWLLVAMLYAHSRAGLIAVVPVALPVLAVFGTMGYLQIPLDTSTSMVAAISLGICVDDTMHFMARYHHHTRAHGDQVRALVDTVREEIVPLLSTSVALALGFFTLALSSFPPVAHFGLLSALAMAVALLGTLTLLPLLLATTQLVTLWDLLTLELDPAVLERCPLFQGMRPWQVKKLVLLGGLRRFADGETIVRQGESGDEMFVLLEGKASAWQPAADGNRTHLRALGPGDSFGEIALVCASPRTADVIAQGPVRVLGLDWSRVQRLGTLFPRITSRLFLNLAAVLGQRLAGDGARTPPGPG